MDPQIAYQPGIDRDLGISQGFNQTTGALNVRQLVKNTAPRSVCRVKLCLGTNGTDAGYLEVQLRSSVGGIVAGSTLYGKSTPIAANTLNGANPVTVSPGGTCGTSGNGQVVAFTFPTPASIPAADFWIVLREVPNSECTGNGTPYPCCTGSGAGSCALVFGPSIGVADNATGYPTGCAGDCTTYGLYKSTATFLQDMWFVTGLE